jgi:hypothetical protein
VDFYVSEYRRKRLKYRKRAVSFGEQCQWNLHFCDEVRFLVDVSFVSTV